MDEVGRCSHCSHCRKRLLAAEQCYGTARCEDCWTGYLDDEGNLVSAAAAYGTRQSSSVIRSTRVVRPQPQFRRKD